MKRNNLIKDLLLVIVIAAIGALFMCDINLGALTTSMGKSDKYVGQWVSKSTYEKNKKTDLPFKQMIVIGKSGNDYVVEIKNIGYDIEYSAYNPLKKTYYRLFWFDQTVLNTIGRKTDNGIAINETYSIAHDDTSDNIIMYGNRYEPLGLTGISGVKKSLKDTTINYVKTGKFSFMLKDVEPESVD